jgi:hypothetical protein
VGCASAGGKNTDVRRHDLAIHSASTCGCAGMLFARGAEPRRAWRSQSIRPAVTAERRVSRERPRPTAAGSRTSSHLQSIHVTAVAASGRWAVFQRSLQPAAANHAVCSQPHPSLHIEIPRSLSFFSASTRDSVRGIPALAASMELRSLARGAPVLPMNRFISWRLPRCPAGLLSGVGCNRTQVSHAACSHALQMGPSGGVAPCFRARLPAQCPRWLQAGPDGPLSKKLNETADRGRKWLVLRALVIVTRRRG